MTRRRSIYDPSTGFFTGQVIYGAMAAPDGLAEMEGAFDPASQRVDLATGQVVDYIPPQPADTEDYTYIWNADKKRWVARSTLQLNKKARKAPIRAAQDEAVATQHNHVRNLLLALAKGNTAANAQTNLQAIDDEIATLKAALDAIDACTTQEQLDALPPWSPPP